MKQRQVTATEFKAKCLAILDEVNENGDVVTITKRGKPVATLQPVKKQAWKSLENALEGEIEIVGNIVNFNTADDWEAFRPTPSPANASKPKRRGRAA